MDEVLKNININIDTKESFTIDGDKNRVIKLDTHDVNLVNRLSEAIPKMRELDKRWSALTEAAGVMDDHENVEDAIADIDKFSTTFQILEADARQIVDDAFDSQGMCDTILGDSSIFSPVNGKFKYDQIIDVLVQLYENSIRSEVNKFNRAKVANKTAKYVKK